MLFRSFYFATVADVGKGNAQDRITDFVPGEDRVDFSAIDANTVLAGDQAFTFIGSAAFSAAGQLRYASGVLSADVNGDKTTDFELLLVGAPAINWMTDIIL